MERAAQSSNSLAISTKSLSELQNRLSRVRQTNQNTIQNTDNDIKALQESVRSKLKIFLDTSEQNIPGQPISFNSDTTHMITDVKTSVIKAFSGQVQEGYTQLVGKLNDEISSHNTTKQQLDELKAQISKLQVDDDISKQQIAQESSAHEATRTSLLAAENREKLAKQEVSKSLQDLRAEQTAHQDTKDTLVTLETQAKILQDNLSASQKDLETEQATRVQVEKNLTWAERDILVLTQSVTPTSSDFGRHIRSNRIPSPLCVADFRPSGILWERLVHSEQLLHSFRSWDRISHATFEMLFQFKNNALPSKFILEIWCAWERCTVAGFNIEVTEQLVEVLMCVLTGNGICTSTCFTALHFLATILAMLSNGSQTASRLCSELVLQGDMLSRWEDAFALDASSLSERMLSWSNSPKSQNCLRLPIQWTNEENPADCVLDLLGDGAVIAVQMDRAGRSVLIELELQGLEMFMARDRFWIRILHPRGISLWLVPLCESLRARRWFTQLGRFVMTRADHRSEVEQWHGN